LLQAMATNTTPSLSDRALQGAKQWAIAANLINQQGLTAEGRVVAAKDPYLEATVTAWLIHFNLSTASQPSLWRYLVFDFLPKHQTFTQDELINHCLENFPRESPENLKKQVRLILKTYIDSQPITKIKFLIQTHKIYLVGDTEVSNSYTFGYLLAKSWEQEFRTQSSVLVNQIIDMEVDLRSILGMDEERLRQQLDILAKHEIIEQRSAKPHLAGVKPQARQGDEQFYQVHRNWESSLNLLGKAYDNDILTPNRPLVQSLAETLNEDDETPDFLRFLEWASNLAVLDGGSNIMIKLVS
ncbi:MAG: DUF4007 family protein, partial [Leptolyngbyaceae cyanobacterium]